MRTYCGRVKDCWDEVDMAPGEHPGEIGTLPLNQCPLLRFGFCSSFLHFVAALNPEL